MNTPNVPPDPPLRAGDLRWTVPPIDYVERINPLTLDDHETRIHVADLRIEIQWLRRLLHEALTCIAKLTAQLNRANRQIQDRRAA